jgi:peptidoglycan hydrolase CwlO-like protein
MDKYTALVAIAALISGTIMISAVAQAIASSIGKRRTQRLPDDSAVTRIEERLSHIEQSIDAMAVEVERISEGQRFTTKLLSERHAGTP